MTRVRLAPTSRQRSTLIVVATAAIFIAVWLSRSVRGRRNEKKNKNKNKAAIRGRVLEKNENHCSSRKHF